MLLTALLVFFIVHAITSALLVQAARKVSNSLGSRELSRTIFLFTATSDQSFELSHRRHHLHHLAGLDYDKTVFHCGHQKHANALWRSRPEQHLQWSYLVYRVLCDPVLSLLHRLFILEGASKLQRRPVCLGLSKLQSTMLHALKIILKFCDKENFSAVFL